MEHWQVKQRQALPLEVKIQKTLLRVREWYDYWDGQVYVSYSGGIDSTVLLHLVRTAYPDVRAVFFNTGLEFPEIVRFCRDTSDCLIVRPKMRFKDVIEKYGWPLVSKQQALYLRQARNTKSDYLRSVRLNGKPRRDGKGVFGKVSEKWKFLLDAPFQVSEQCCDVMKKRPAKSFCKKTGLRPIIGTMAADSRLRMQQYMQYGCNSFDMSVPRSTPIAFWSREDVVEYLDMFEVPYASVYDMGYEHTGCLFCGFGVHKEARPNRFQRLYETHPGLWRYVIEKLGMKEILEFCGIPYRPCSDSKQLELPFQSNSSA